MTECNDAMTLAFHGLSRFRKITVKLFWVIVVFSQPLGAQVIDIKEQRHDSQVRIAVASNFINVAAQLKKQFVLRYGLRSTQVQMIQGSTGKHFAQIVQGAPYDILLAADAVRPARLEQLGLGRDRQTYAYGRLAIWSQNRAIADEQELKRLLVDSTKKFVIANPRFAPYGSAAVEVMDSLGVKNPKARVIRAENVAQAMQFLDSGNVDFGFVALSQVLNQQRALVFSRDDHSPIEQQAVILTSTTLANDFMDFLFSTQARKVIRAYGYDVAIAARRISKPDEWN